MAFTFDPEIAARLFTQLSLRVGPEERSTWVTGLDRLRLTELFQPLIL